MPMNRERTAFALHSTRKLTVATDLLERHWFGCQQPTVSPRWFVGRRGGTLLHAWDSPAP